MPPRWYNRVAIMERMGWTAAQYYNENSPADIERLTTMWELQEKVDKAKRREEKLKAKYAGEQDAKRSGTR